MKSFWLKIVSISFFILDISFANPMLERRTHLAPELARVGRPVTMVKSGPQGAGVQAEEKLKRLKKFAQKWRGAAPLELDITTHIDLDYQREYPTVSGIERFINTVAAMPGKLKGANGRELYWPFLKNNIRVTEVRGGSNTGKIFVVKMVSAGKPVFFFKVSPTRIHQEDQAHVRLAKLQQGRLGRLHDKGKTKAEDWYRFYNPIMTKLEALLHYKNGTGVQRTIEVLHAAQGTSVSEFLFENQEAHPTQEYRALGTAVGRALAAFQLNAIDYRSSAYPAQWVVSTHDDLHTGNMYYKKFPKKMHTAAVTGGSKDYVAEDFYRIYYIDNETMRDHAGPIDIDLFYGFILASFFWWHIVLESEQSWSNLLEFYKHWFSGYVQMFPIDKRPVLVTYIKRKIISIINIVKQAIEDRKRFFGTSADFITRFNAYGSYFTLKNNLYTLMNNSTEDQKDMILGLLVKFITSKTFDNRGYFDIVLRRLEQAVTSFSALASTTDVPAHLRVWKPGAKPLPKKEARKEPVVAVKPAPQPVKQQVVVPVVKPEPKVVEPVKPPVVTVLPKPEPVAKPVVPVPQPAVPVIPIDKKPVALALQPPVNVALETPVKKEGLFEKFSNWIKRWWYKESDSGNRNTVVQKKFEVKPAGNTGPKLVLPVADLPQPKPIEEKVEVQQPLSSVELGYVYFFKEGLTDAIEEKNPEFIDRTLRNLEQKSELFIHQVLNTQNSVTGDTLLTIAIKKPTMHFLRAILSNKYPKIAKVLSVNIPRTSAISHVETFPIMIAFALWQEKQGGHLEPLYYTIVQLLMQHHSFDPNVKNVQGKTILHVACEKLNTELIDSVLKLKKCDATIKDAQGKTAYDIVQAQGDSPFIKDILVKLAYHEI